MAVACFMLVRASVSSALVLADAQFTCCDLTEDDDLLSAVQMGKE